MSEQQTGTAPAGWYPVEDGSHERWWDGTQWGQSRPLQGPPPAPAAERKRRRIFMWVFLAIQVLFIIWVVSAAASAGGDPENCGTLSREVCNDAEAVGTGLGVLAIILFWMVVDFLLGVGYVIYRLARRP